MVQTTQIGRKLAKKRALKARMERAALLPPEPKRISGKEYIELMEAEGVFGAWANRDDIGDSAEYARKLREQAQNRDRS